MHRYISSFCQDKYIINGEMKLSQKGYLRSCTKKRHEQSLLMSTFVHGQFVLSFLELFHARQHKISATSNMDIYFR